MLEDDKDFSVSSLASFNSFSASTSMSIEEEVEVDALRVEAIGFFSSALRSTSSASKSSPFTVFPDFKEDFKSSKDGSSSARASSAVFTAAERSRSPPLVDAEEEVAEEAAASVEPLFAEKYASNASLSEMLSSDSLRALNSSALRAIFASAGAVAPTVEEAAEEEESAFDDDDGESNEKYPSSFFIVSSVSRSSFSLSESPSDKSIIFEEEEEEVVEPNSPEEEEDAASFFTTTVGGFGGKGKTSPSFAVFLFSSLLLLLLLILSMVFLRLPFAFTSIVDAFAEEDVLDDAKPRAVDASPPREALEDEERDDFDDALFFASTPTNAEEQHPAIPVATTASLMSAAFAEVVLLFVELVFVFISRS